LVTAVPDAVQVLVPPVLVNAVQTFTGPCCQVLVVLFRYQSLLKSPVRSSAVGTKALVEDE